MIVILAMMQSVLIEHTIVLCKSVIISVFYLLTVLYYNVLVKDNALWYHCNLLL